MNDLNFLINFEGQKQQITKKTIANHADFAVEQKKTAKEVVNHHFLFIQVIDKVVRISRANLNLETAKIAFLSHVVKAMVFMVLVLYAINILEVPSLEMNLPKVQRTNFFGENKMLWS